VDVLRPEITQVSVQIPTIQERNVNYEVPVYRETVRETVN